MESNNKRFSLKELNGRPLRLLIGGFPCTKFSIAQQKDREIAPYSGEGWELFHNYLLAKEKFKPDFYLAENNKSIAEEIKNEVTKLLGNDYITINSALVSAQTRQRCYWSNILGVEQPEDRGILLKDILESGMVWREKSYTLDANYWKTSGRDFNRQSGRRKCVAEPIRIGTIENESKNKNFDSQQYRVYSPDGKSVTICGQGGGVGAKTGLYATPVKLLSEKEMDYMVRETHDGRNHFDYGYIHSTTKDKSQCLLANLHKGVPYNVLCEKIDPDGNFEIDGKFIYSVKDKQITYKGNKYRLNLPDGYYIIRKLTVLECERLQTMPEGYTAFGVDENGKEVKISDTQRYKQLGNGWTAEVIIHILSYIDVSQNYPIEVLSMYDGIATGRYCLERLGYTNITYKAYEIDEYAKKVAMKNYPDIIQCGDAYQVRGENWKY